MARQVSRDTLPEMGLRRVLHRRGRRFRVHYRPEASLRRTPDIVFTRARVVVFVDGCFWHQCPDHKTAPTANAEWWATKLEKNSQRDRDTDARFAALGWTVVRVWEHLPADQAADLVETALDRHQGQWEF
jgi:DNA mismatch endonuclease, patch repair protein